MNSQYSEQKKKDLICLQTKSPDSEIIQEIAGS
jgi:hypothetical protein